MDSEIAKVVAVLNPLEYTPVGSRVTCNPAPTDTDEDWLILVRKRVPEILSRLDFEMDTGRAHYEPSEGQFNSWRRDDLNLIVTDDGRFYEKFSIATDLAKRFNLLHKRDRVALFQAVLYGRPYPPC
jgi:hypothetical protein